MQKQHKLDKEGELNNRYVKKTIVASYSSSWREIKIKHVG
jgi:hypothetical protein